MKRTRKESLPKSQRNFIAAVTPEIPRAKVDARPPLMGQRKRNPVKRPRLLPTPLQAD